MAFEGIIIAANCPDDVVHAAAFGRMTLSNDQALEKLAANVRAATTTSASDRAKQIFVQAWYVSTYRSVKKLKSSYHRHHRRSLG